MATSPTQVYNTARFILHGMHSTPLIRRIEEGRTATWVAGDFGSRNNESGAGKQSFGLGEAGISHAFASTQLSLSLGQGINNNRLSSGTTNTVLSYAILTSLSRLSSISDSLYLNVDFLYQDSDMRVNRQYINSGNADSSIGTPNASTKAFRIRFDWENLLTAYDKKIGITPYFETTYGMTKVSSYTEIGGGFPAYYNSRKQRSIENHVGTDLTYAIRKNLRLRGKLEIAHLRDLGNNSAATGQILGLSGFSIPGEKRKETWRRLGFGFENELDEKRNHSIFSMINVSDEFSKKNYWLNISYQIKI